MAEIAQRSLVDWIAFKIQRARRHGSLGAWARHRFRRRGFGKTRFDYCADAMGVFGRNLSFLTEPPFAEAWAEAARLNAEGWKGRRVPNIEWRAHIACWAATHGLTLDGDFVECGVHTGLLSRTVCRYLDFAKQPKTFWLFDTWRGIPTDGMDDREKREAVAINSLMYDADVFAFAERNFAPFDNVRLVRGALPGTLDDSAIGAIAYLSIDLNNAHAEKAVIERLWPKIAKGAIILIDDYGHRGHEEQRDMWDAFAHSVGRTIATLPTAQGLLIK